MEKRVKESKILKELKKEHKREGEEHKREGKFLNKLPKGKCQKTVKKRS
jgi:hypothetical protein